MGYTPLGRVTIESVNQIGERVRFVPKSNGFTLGKRGSIFILYALIESDPTLPDFRELSSIPVCVEVEGRYLKWDPVSGRAVASEGRPDSQRAPLHLVKRKFSGSSTSICCSCEGMEKWLRHSNSRLRFDPPGTGSEFFLDASFMIRPHVEPTKIVLQKIFPEVPSRNRKRSRESHQDIPDSGGDPIPESSKSSEEENYNLSPSEAKPVSELWGRINKVMLQVRDNQNRTRIIGRTS